MSATKPDKEQGDREERAAAPFDIDVAVERLRDVVRTFPKAGLFELYDDGHTTVFEILAACIVSIRTRDETLMPVARRLFARARSPEQVAALSVEELDVLLAPAMYHETKARQIHAIARRAVDEWNGALPCDETSLLSLPGVGPKCAHLALGIACGQPFIGVDVHVHRITNRWGTSLPPTPEKTMGQLEVKLPRAYWVQINALLVLFGKHVCTGALPRCSTCPLRDMCRRVGVGAHR